MGMVRRASREWSPARSVFEALDVAEYMGGLPLLVKPAWTLLEPRRARSWDELESHVRWALAMSPRQQVGIWIE